MKDWIELNRDGKHHYYDPIVLDLDGDGIETLAHNKNKGAMFDFNNDGLRNATGWVKADDGISQADELRSLISLEIQALNLNYQNTHQTLNGGNVLSQIGSYVKTDGTVHKMGDVNFAFDRLHTQYIGHNSVLVC